MRVEAAKTSTTTDMNNNILSCVSRQLRLLDNLQRALTYCLPCPGSKGHNNTCCLACAKASTTRHINNKTHQQHHLSRMC
mmetsp:Transcript_48987/g.71834  ORF Transcript_48987/g.71834 Transcript_48987/m.71834 type:complete len:80 (+) Transcript_48987:461-700(+)